MQESAAVLCAVGIIISLIGIGCMAYSTTPNQEFIRSLRNQLSALQGQLDDYVRHYGSNDPFVDTMMAQIQTVRAAINAAEQPVYPYVGLGIAVLVVGIVIIGVGLALPKRETTRHKRNDNERDTTRHKRDDNEQDTLPYREGI